jgi:hypothetical protein
MERVAIFVAFRERERHVEVDSAPCVFLIVACI